MAGGKAERVQASFPKDLTGPVRLNIKLFLFSEHPKAVRN